MLLKHSTGSVAHLCSDADAKWGAPKEDYVFGNPVTAAAAHDVRLEGEVSPIATGHRAVRRHCCQGCLAGPTTCDDDVNFGDIY